MAESNPIFEFAQLWEMTKAEAETIGLSLQPSGDRGTFLLCDESSDVLFQSARLEECSAFMEGVRWERAPQG